MPHPGYSEGPGDYPMLRTMEIGLLGRFRPDTNRNRLKRGPAAGRKTARADFDASRYPALKPDFRPGNPISGPMRFGGGFDVGLCLGREVGMARPPADSHNYGLSR